MSQCRHNRYDETVMSTVFMRQLCRRSLRHGLLQSVCNTELKRRNRLNLIDNLNRYAAWVGTARALCMPIILPVLMVSTDARRSANNAPYERTRRSKTSSCDVVACSCVFECMFGKQLCSSLSLVRLRQYGNSYPAEKTVDILLGL